MIVITITLPFVTTTVAQGEYVVLVDVFVTLAFQVIIVKLLSHALTIATTEEYVDMGNVSASITIWECLVPLIPNKIFINKYKYINSNKVEVVEVVVVVLMTAIQEACVFSRHVSVKRDISGMTVNL